jgi:flagellar basal body-associated protein FliL
MTHNVLISISVIVGLAALAFAIRGLYLRHKRQEEQAKKQDSVNANTAAVLSQLTEAMANFGQAMGGSRSGLPAALPQPAVDPAAPAAEIALEESAQVGAPVFPRRPPLPPPVMPSAPAVHPIAPAPAPQDSQMAQLLAGLQAIVSQNAKPAAPVAEKPEKPKKKRRFGFATIVIGAAILAIVGVVASQFIMGDNEPGAGKPHSALADKASKVEELAAGATAPSTPTDFDCGPCDMVVESGMQPEYAKLANGSNGWKFVKCAGSPGCETCSKVNCDDNSTPPQKPGCACAR